MDAIDNKLTCELYDRLSEPRLRRKLMKESGYLSDCSFLVCGNSNESKQDKKNDNGSAKLFKCHKMILSEASNVFNRMFYGNLPEESFPLQINDTTPEIFDFMLNYIYTNEVDEKFVTFENFSQLMYIGNKYMLENFNTMCIDIISSLTWDSSKFCSIFEYACRFDNSHLLLICHEKMINDHMRMLDPHNFTKLNINCLRQFFLYMKKQILKNYPKLNTIFPEAIKAYVQHNKIVKDSTEFLRLLDAISVFNPPNSSHQSPFRNVKLPILAPNFMSNIFIPATTCKNKGRNYVSSSDESC